MRGKIRNIIYRSYNVGWGRSPPRLEKISTIFIEIAPVKLQIFYTSKNIKKFSRAFNQKYKNNWNFYSNMEFALANFYELSLNFPLVILILLQNA